MTTDEKYMSRCIQLARNGFYGAAPNPMVGAVIVHDGKIIGEGYHVRCGGPHAEVNAVRSVRNPELLKESTIYVSLEPCSHYGKTPPCADLIVEKGIPRVVVGCMDPFAKVAGRGIRKLQEAGIEVTVSDGQQTGIGMIYFSVKPANTLGAVIDPVVKQTTPDTRTTIALKPYVHGTSVEPAELTAVETPSGAATTVPRPFSTR